MSRDKQGHATLLWKGNILVGESEGIFDEEGIKSGQQMLKKAVLDKGLSRWRRLQVLSKETMGSPEAVMAIKDMYRWCEDNGCFATGIVIGNKLQDQIIESLFSDFNVKTFADAKSAEEWLNKQ